MQTVKVNKKPQAHGRPSTGFKKRRPQVPGKAPQSKAKTIAQIEGQYGVDSRSDSVRVETALTSSLVVQGTDNTVDVKVAFDPTSIQALAAGIVLSALRRGWYATLGENGSYVYYSYVYLYQAFLSAMKSSVPALQSAPRWYWMITQALNPKVLQFKTGSVTYSWDFGVGSIDIPPSVLQMGNQNVNLGIINYNSAPISGFYTLAVPPSYDPALGASAIKSLFNVFQGDGLNEIVDPYPTDMIKDSSAFAAVYPEYGQARLGPGGSATTLYSERMISHPILSKIAIYQQGAMWRGWTQTTRSGGTAFYVLPRMVELQDSKLLKNHVPPMFKTFDFDEFYEVLALTMGKALELQARSNVEQPAGPCPLTPQQVQILLRQTLIQRFENEKAQDLQFLQYNDTPFYPFVVAVNGNSQSNFPMKLPQFLCENIRACAKKIVRLGKGTNSQLDILPILGRYERPPLTNYTWGTDGALVFTPEDPANAVIDLVQCSYTYQNSTGYLDLNGDELQNYATVWNEWITSLGTFLSPLSNPGDERGISALSTVTITRSYRPVQAGISNIVAGGIQQRYVKRQSVKELGVRVNMKAKVRAAPIPGSDYFKDVLVGLTSFTNKPLSAIWKYQRVMILPSYLSLAGDEGPATTSMRQVFQVEPYSLAAGTVPFNTALDNGAISALGIHSQMAELDVKSSFASQSEVTTDLNTLAMQGRGGLFTSIAGMFAEDVLGIKGGRQIAGAIGQVTGL